LLPVSICTAFEEIQSEGGPAIKEIPVLLKGSDAPGLATFMRAAVALRLIGATDGHAKNFSVLSPGASASRPLYDVLTAQPSLDAKQIQPKGLKLAISVGKSRHYRMNEIQPRHFIRTAEMSGVGTPGVRSIFESLLESFEPAFARVLNKLPKEFPSELAESIRIAARHPDGESRCSILIPVGRTKALAEHGRS